MRHFRFRYLHLTFVLFVAALKPAFAQVPDFSKVPGLDDGDTLNITYLIKNGVKISDGKATCWFPKDSLSEKQMSEITAMMSAGIKGAETFINAPLSWQLHHPDEPYTFYFRYDKFVSHASHAGFVSIPFWRIKEGKAPWLHEVIHEMLYTTTGRWDSPDITDEEANEQMPLWLLEGLPDYISLKVCLTEQLPCFDVFSNTFQANSDSLFVKEIESAQGSYILSFIGSKGMMPELFSEARNVYAPAFYHGSAAFVEYLSATYGIDLLLTSISSFGKEQETIEALTGKSLTVLKKEWLKKIEIVE